MVVMDPVESLGWVLEVDTLKIKAVVPQGQAERLSHECTRTSASAGRAISESGVHPDVGFCVARVDDQPIQSLAELKVALQVTRKQRRLVRITLTKGALVASPSGAAMSETLAKAVAAVVHAQQHGMATRQKLEALQNEVGKSDHASSAPLAQAQAEATAAVQAFHVAETAVGNAKLKITMAGGRLAAVDRLVAEVAATAEKGRAATAESGGAAQGSGPSGGGATERVAVGESTWRPHPLPGQPRWPLRLGAVCYAAGEPDEDEDAGGISQASFWAPT